MTPDLDTLAELVAAGAFGPELEVLREGVDVGDCPIVGAAAGEESRVNVALATDNLALTRSKG